MAKDVAVSEVNNLAKTIKLIEARQDEFALSLPAHLPSAKFVRVLKTAIAARPELSRVDPGLLIIECQKCAADGLVADGRQATILVYNQNNRRKVNGVWKDNWQKVPKYMPMKDGLIQRARNSGELKKIAAYLVYEAEAANPHPEPGVPGFRRWIDDDGEHVLHEPALKARGAIVGVYSQAALKDGLIDYCWMPIEEVMGIAKRSKSKDKDGNAVGPWKSDREQMIVKTVFRRHSKTLPMDSDLARVFERDDDLYELNPAASDPHRPAGKVRGGAAKALADSRRTGGLGDDATVTDVEPDNDDAEDERQPEPEKTKTKATPAKGGAAKAKPRQADADEAGDGRPEPPDDDGDPF